MSLAHGSAGRYGLVELLPTGGRAIAHEQSAAGGIPMFTGRIPRTFTMTAALVISASVIGANGTRVSAQDEAAFAKALAGTWVVNVDQPGFPPSQRHFTFNADGGLVTNDDLQVGPNFVEHQTIGQGNWIRTGHRSVAATIAGQRFNLEGSLLGTYKVRMNLELNPLASEWTGRFRIDIALPNGQVIFTSDGSFEATALAVEPL
jgi:hypothetical protein